MIAMTAYEPDSIGDVLLLFLGSRILVTVVLPVLAVALLGVLIVYNYGCYAPKQDIRNRMQAAQASRSAEAEVTAVQQTGPCVWRAVLRPDAASSLPEALMLDYRSPVTEGQRVTVRVLAEAPSFVLMTKDDFYAHCISLEQEKERLERKARKFRVGIIILGLAIVFILPGSLL